MNHSAKFDAASFVLVGEIRKRTNKQTNTHTHKQTNSNRYIHTLPISPAELRWNLALEYEVF